MKKGIKQLIDDIYRQAPYNISISLLYDTCKQVVLRIAFVAL